MKICLLSSSFPRFEGDFAGVFIYQLGRHLLEFGVDVIALVPHEHNLPHRESLGDIKVYRFPYFFPRSQQRLCYGSGIATNMKYSQLASVQLPLYSVSQLLALVWAKHQLKIDAVNSHWLVTQGFNAALIHKWFNLPHICTIHAAGLFALQRVRVGVQIARFIVRHSDHIFTVSSYIKSTLEALIDQTTNAEVLPMGIEVNKFAKTDIERSKTHILLFVGRFVEKKGVQYLIEAMPIVIQALPRTRLMLVGNGPLGKELEIKVNKLGLEQYIQFLGRRGNQEMPSIYAQADAVVVPSIVDRSGETEGMPVVALEALAAGKPVIASDVSGIADVIEDGVNGFLAKSKSSADLADRILRTFQCLSRSDQLQKGARATAERYDWRIIAQRYAKAFQRVTMSAVRD